MWGITFEKGTGNQLITGKARFEVQGDDYQRTTYELTFGTVGMTLRRENEDGQMVTVRRNITAADVERLLPQEFDMDWTWRDFLVALTFWGEGYKLGLAHGQWDGARRARTAAAESD